MRSAQDTGSSQVEILWSKRQMSRVDATAVDREGHLAEVLGEGRGCAEPVGCFVPERGGLKPHRPLAFIYVTALSQEADGIFDLTGLPQLPLAVPHIKFNAKISQIFF